LIGIPNQLFHHASGSLNVQITTASGYSSSNSGVSAAPQVSVTEI
jgi:hypothetical protein